MRRATFRKILLSLALLLCQLTAFAHVAQHAVLELDQTCQICVHAPGLDAGAAVPVQAACEIGSEHEAPVAVISVAPVMASSRYTPIRAPPFLIV